METYIQLILILALAKYCLKAALTSRLWIMFGYGATASFVGLLLYPLVIEQPASLIKILLANKQVVTNWAVITTIEAVVGIFISVYLLDNYFLPHSRRKRSMFILKVIPGILFFIAIGYFELLFFKWRVGSDFTATAILYAAVVFVLVSLISLLLRTFLGGESMKLELKVFLNLAILIIGLLVSSLVADYSISHAETTIQWLPLLALTVIAIVFFIIGLYSPRINYKSLFKYNLKWNK